METPTIVVAGPDSGGAPAWLFTSALVRLAGGHPVRATPSKPAPESFDGLIIGGGEDVLMRSYGDEVIRKTPAPARLEAQRRWRDYLVAPLLRLLKSLRSVHGRSRDPSEMALLQRAEELRVPVLGICRGAQLMNVFHGGKLHRSLEAFYEDAEIPWTALPQKPVALSGTSRLRTFLGQRTAVVNSLHHMAVSDLGSDLEAVAFDERGIVQAIEHRNRDFYIGVQWHPEYLPQREEQRRLFARLVEHARLHTNQVEHASRRNHTPHLPA